MRRGISTYCYVQQRLHPGMLERLTQSGAEDIELFAARNHFDFHDPQHVREIAHWFRNNGRELHSLHSPMFFGTEFERAGQPSVNIVNREKRARVEAMDEIKRAIEVAEQLPFKFLVQHIGDAHEAWDPRKFDDAMTAIEHLKAFARPLGVNVLVENIPNEMATPAKLVELIQTGHFSDVGVCFDTGHAHLMGGIEQDFEALKPLIRSTHVHDNAGESDDHKWPGTGNIDWQKTIELLSSAPGAPPLLFEVRGEDGVPVAPKAEQTFRKLLGEG
jgi:sugar phosphate isomerase/epimerase